MVRFKFIPLLSVILQVQQQRYVNSDDSELAFHSGTPPSNLASLFCTSILMQTHRRSLSSTSDLGPKVSVEEKQTSPNPLQTVTNEKGPALSHHSQKEEIDRVER